jgi:HTH-type transcriptional regulator, competence development regulator
MGQTVDERLIKKFGRNLKEIREKKGVSLRDLALEADLSANTISEIELGKRDPRMTTVVKLASALGIDPAELLPKL